MNKFIVISVFLVTVLLLSSCGSPAIPSEAPVITEEVIATEPPIATATDVPDPYGSSSTEAPEDSDPAPSEEVFIDIADFQFSQSSVTISVGTTVTWTNKDNGEHTVTSDNGVFNSSVTNGATFSFTFTEAGEFPYHCDIHRSMKGKIIVVE